MFARVSIPVPDAARNNSARSAAVDVAVAPSAAGGNRATSCESSPMVARYDSIPFSVSTTCVGRPAKAAVKLPSGAVSVPFS